jgi:IS5 family transposase
MAIEVCLAVRKVYHLAFRQTEGFIESFFDRIGCNIKVPCYTTLCRRSGNLPICLTGSSSKAITDIVVDSTGLKVYGEGEWKVRKHGAGKRRTWMKMHVAVDSDSQQVAAITLTANAVDDATEAASLLGQIKKVNSLSGDGAYGKDKVRRVLHAGGTRQIIPPQHNAVLDKKSRAHRKERDEAIRTIEATGRKEWKKQQGYHQRSKSETTMFRYKTIIGGSIAARKMENQKTEVTIGCKILNTMLSMGKPKSRLAA